MVYVSTNIALAENGQQIDRTSLIEDRHRSVLV